MYQHRHIFLIICNIYIYISTFDHKERDKTLIIERVQRYDSQSWSDRKKKKILFIYIYIKQQQKAIGNKHWKKKNAQMLVSKAV